MSKLIDFNSSPVKDVLPVLLKDRTTGRNIIFATDAYLEVSTYFGEKCEIEIEMLRSGELQICPRVEKHFDEQRSRQKAKAEVFTPSWICNQMNNYCDQVFFQRDNVFNHAQDQTWVINSEQIQFSPQEGWKRYVESTRLEITCGEAPYLVSRYDAATGQMIPLESRIGILDRKLRVVSENTKTRRSWLNWSKKAFQNVYGYEFHGDSLLIARANLLLTFVDYYKACWSVDPDLSDLKEVAQIISWNLWQMDGLKLTIPYREPSRTSVQLDLFGYDEQVDSEPSDCVIFDWANNKTVLFKDIKR
uniref:Restriction endonuclease subunit M n=1 Tax=uncultured prokaryote TaxID=198431 RepID=A0A0H5PZ32_9ZZZZ|nr:hypothetical protein [uncultured prokaryote]